MNIYAVWALAYNVPDRLLGIFRTEEAARKRIADKIEENHGLSLCIQMHTLED